MSDKDTSIVTINLKNANSNIINIQEKQKEELEILKTSDSSSNESLSEESIDEEVEALISKTDSQLLKEKKDKLLTVIGRLKLYQKGFEKKKKKDLVSIIRTYK